MRPIFNINITATAPDMDRFTDREDLKRFYKDLGYDGMELMLCGSEGVPELFPREDLVGLHLKYFHNWYDFWTGNVEDLNKEYDSPEIWQQYYGGTTQEDMLAGWRKELDLAQELGVKYVVFHIAECTLEESITYKLSHTDEEICAAAVDIINRLMDGKPYRFHFLVENLWWSGLTLTRPEITRQVMDGIHYYKKGIMLDTGHLLNTNRSLRTQAEAVDYVLKILTLNGDLCRYIKAFHLNQSLSGEYVQKVLADPPELKGGYWDRLMQIFPHIFSIDYHKPFTDPGVTKIIKRVRPEFVTVELITSDREEHRAGLEAQMNAIRQGGLE